MGRRSGEMDRTLFGEALASLAQEGWELVWVFMDQSLQREKDETFSSSSAR
jgi:hypothetical protein